MLVIEQERAALKRETGGVCLISYYNSLKLIAVLLCCLSVFSSCEESFQPLKENKLYYFSIYGYLNASADTQWVRVAPVRDQLDMPPVVPEMLVTLEHLESGHTVIMNDSLFGQGSGSSFINFWTTMGIQHGESYRLKAERPDGAASQVTVTIPEELPTPRLRKEERQFGQGPAYTLFISGVEHLADVQTKWYVQSGTAVKDIYSFSYRNKAEKTEQYGGGYRVFIDPELEEEKVSPISSTNDIVIFHRQIFVASAGPEWIDDIGSVDELIYTLPGGISNVENGLGYMVGIDRKIIPYRSCKDDQGMLVPCPEEDPYW